MTQTDKEESVAPAADKGQRRLGRSIALGLVLGVASGIFFGEYCQPLQMIGDAYVGLLQMTVLPYLVLSLIGKLGRLDASQARRIGLTALVVLLIFWSIGIVLILLASGIFPPIEARRFSARALRAEPTKRVNSCRPLYRPTCFVR